MSFLINSLLPDFKGHSQYGNINYNENLKGNWCLIFNYISDFSPICLTVLFFN